MIRRSRLRRRNLSRPLVKRTGISFYKPQLYSPKEKMQNCSWFFKVGDPDDHPSVPHAHDKEHGYRLDAWTGNIYPKGNERNKIIGKLSRRELSRLHSDQKFLEYAQKQIKWYRENYPNISFYVPDWVEPSLKMKKMQPYSKSNSNEFYIFLSKAIIKE